jgi:hypothetical protein
MGATPLRPRRFVDSRSPSRESARRCRRRRACRAAAADREPDRRLERDEILQHVIRRQHQHERIVARELAHGVRGERDGGRGVAAHGL